MSVKAFFSKILAKIVVKQTAKWANKPVESQQKILQLLLHKAKYTQFGIEHHFENIQSHEDFVKHVPIRDYEGFVPYINQIIEGKKDILWQGTPLYLAKTSGTTSGAKFIPLSKESMPYHIKATRDAILHYINETKNTDFIDGKMIFLQGSPKLEEKNGLKYGRLSGIAAHYVPSYLQQNRLPSYKTNCIEDWETKVDTIIQETIHQKMSLISGIPSWVQMYFEKIQQHTGKTISEVFPHFSLFIFGGLNFEPYRNRFRQLIGKDIDSIELFPASEGFFAYQNSQKSKDMLLLLNAGIFYEFVKADEFFNTNPKRYTIADVELGVNYAMIISTNAGLWAYNIGDTVQFTNLAPYKIIVTGRIKHYISAFGEHVIAKEVETALKNALEKFPEVVVNEFTVAPQVTPSEGLPHHQWYIEFASEPNNIHDFAAYIDEQMCLQNIYYKDLIEGKILQQLIISKVPVEGFQQYMKSIGKLGGQNKIPRLSNDRKIADWLDNNTKKEAI
ncbi:MAG: GH3 auxin-responsive promoter family protein [Bacteroidota bacterium]|nr:GH3 auxin-responsive promoter family protein [Bacteroidota bacterium]